MSRRRAFIVAAAILPLTSIAAAAPPAKVIARLDLSKSFRVAPGWTFIATQGPQVQDPQGEDGDLAPGQIHLCLSGPKSPQCSPDLDSALHRREPDMFSEIHYLDEATVVNPRGAAGPSLLMVRTASFHAGDGDQIQSVQLVGYRASEGRFAVVFHEQSGRNNNQEIRLVQAGPLKGAMISVHPTADAPFGYWVDVYRPSDASDYRRVLRYRSATHYGDGNSLAVIDSEMPNILGHLRLWRAGQPLPMPSSPCPRPRLVKTELWCS